MAKELLTYSQVGSDGLDPHSIFRDNPINTVWYHIVTGDAYKLTALRWDAERDLWMVDYEGADTYHPHVGMPQLFTRSVKNFFQRFQR